MALDLTHKLALGTVQWGLPYGIANRSGQPDDAEVARILTTATAHGISVLDTAHGYGDAEALIGRLAEAVSFRVITKIPAIKAARIEKAHLAESEIAFTASLTRLKRNHVEAVLLHHADDLLALAGDSLWSLMQTWKNAGRATEIGVSVYSPSQADAVLARFPIDVIQLPFNVYDRRFAASGALARLKRAGVKVYARSVFLQGLLVLPEGELGEHFARIRTHHGRFHAWARAHKLSPAAAALLFCLGNPDLDYVVIGTESAVQLEQLLAFAGSGAAVDAPASLALDDETILNPSLWKR